MGGRNGSRKYSVVIGTEVVGVVVAADGDVEVVVGLLVVVGGGVVVGVLVACCVVLGGG
jgi:hypothetical protein